MAKLDTTPLQEVAKAYVIDADNGREELLESEVAVLEEVCDMLEDFDARFIQYPLIAGPFVARCVVNVRIDHWELKALLDTLITVDTLRGKK